MASSWVLIIIDKIDGRTLRRSSERRDSMALFNLVNRALDDQVSHPRLAGLRGYEKGLLPTNCMYLGTSETRRQRARPKGFT